MITTVLAGIAGTRYDAAVVDTAVGIAKAHGAFLTAVTAVDVRGLRNVGSVPLGAGQAAQELREYRLQHSHEAIDDAIGAVESQCRASGLKYAIKQEEREQPYDFITSQSRYHDLTVLSLRGILEYEIPEPKDADSSVTLVRLISSGVRPIIAVPAAHRPVSRVFAAYSGSIESAATLRRFLQLRPYKDFELCIATFDMQRERGVRLLRHAAEYCRKHGIEPETVYVPETAKQHLLHEATARGADLIVLGNSAKNLLLRRVFGETALRVIQESELPLFLSQ